MTAFVQCPACGGPVHQIASRCKHCKADLLALREQAQQAARAQQSRLRQTNRGAAPPPAFSGPPVGGPPAGGPPAPAPGRAERRAPTANDAAQHTPAPQIIYVQPSGWSRRWPMAVSSLAVVAIAVSLFLLLRTDGDDDGRLPDRASGSTTPRMVPDDMPSPNMPSPGSPQGAIPPAPADPGGGPAPKSWSTAPDAGMFPVALTETVCAKLADCGFQDDFSDLLCRELAKGLSNPDLDAKVKNGECTYDRGAASQCLQAIDSLSCSMTSANDLTAFFDQATNLFDCSQAYVCR